MYFFKIDDENNIIEFVVGEALDDCIEVTLEEFEEAQRYKKFNPETREFSEPVEATQEDESISSKERIEQLEETVGILAEQLAKQTLGM